MAAWSGFTRKQRQTQIEGLRHGGAMGSRRRGATDFGSGYRGLVNIPASFIDEISPGMQAGAAAIFDTPAFMAGIQSGRIGKGLSPKVLSELKAAQKYTADTGFFFTVVAGDRIKKFPAAARRSFIRHERLHAIDYAYLKHPFIEAERAKRGTLAFETTRISGLVQRLKSRNPHSSWAHMKANFMKLDESGIADMYEAYALKNMFNPKMAHMLASERLAWGYMDDPDFFLKARAAGLKDPRIMKEKGSYKTSHQPGQPRQFTGGLGPVPEPKTKKTVPRPNVHEAPGGLASEAESKLFTGQRAAWAGGGLALAAGALLLRQRKKTKKRRTSKTMSRAI
jgi:hypothetical protein